VHLVNEQDSVPAGLLKDSLSAFHCLTDILDSGQNRGQRDEFRIECCCHETRQRRLARSRRSPKDHGVRLAGFESEPQRLADSKQMGLAYYVFQCLGAQLFREWRGRLALPKKVSH
jgi:hypothetical protein